MNQATRNIMHKCGVNDGNDHESTVQFTAKTKRL